MIPLTPAERLQALEATPVLVLYDTPPNTLALDFSRVATLLEGWLAEKDSEITRLTKRLREVQSEVGAMWQVRRG